MTTLYKPVLIESAEQAEALPIGTMAARENRFYSVKLGDDLWTDGMSAPQCNAEMVGWTALVPIEAEEEWGARQPHPDGRTRGRTRFGAHEAKARLHCEAITGDVPEHRYVTPWEDA